MHDDEDPEYSILKSRMINKMKDEGLTVDDSFGLADITKAAERTISAVSAEPASVAHMQQCSTGPQACAMVFS